MYNTKTTICITDECAFERKKKIMSPVQTALPPEISKVKCLPLCFY